MSGGQASYRLFISGEASTLRNSFLDGFPLRTAEARPGAATTSPISLFVDPRDAVESFIRSNKPPPETKEESKEEEEEGTEATPRAITPSSSASKADDSSQPAVIVHHLLLCRVVPGSALGLPRAAYTDPLAASSTSGDLQDTVGTFVGRTVLTTEALKEVLDHLPASYESACILGSQAKPGPLDARSARLGLAPQALPSSPVVLVMCVHADNITTALVQQRLAHLRAWNPAPVSL